MTHADAACGTDACFVAEPMTPARMFETGVGPHARRSAASAQTGGDDDARDFETQTDVADQRAIATQCPEDLAVSRHQLEAEAEAAASGGRRDSRASRGFDASSSGGGGFEVGARDGPSPTLQGSSSRRFHHPRGFRRGRFASRARDGDRRGRDAILPRARRRRQTGGDVRRSGQPLVRLRAASRRGDDGRTRRDVRRVRAGRERRAETRGGVRAERRQGARVGGDGIDLGVGPRGRRARNRRRARRRGKTHARRVGTGTIARAHLLRHGGRRRVRVGSARVGRGASRRRRGARRRGPGTGRDPGRRRRRRRTRGKRREGDGVETTVVLHRGCLRGRDQLGRGKPRLDRVSRGGRGRRGVVVERRRGRRAGGARRARFPPRRRRLLGRENLSRRDEPSRGGGHRAHGRGSTIRIARSIHPAARDIPYGGGGGGGGRVRGGRESGVVSAPNRD